MLKIFILIRSLGIGGAERQVCVLAQALQKKGHIVTVGIFYSGGSLESELADAGVYIYRLNKKGRWDTIGWFINYIKALRKAKPDVVYSFLTVSNILAIAGKLFSGIPVVWGIRASDMRLEAYDWLSRFTARIEKSLSIYPSNTIFNAYSSLEHHKKLGYCVDNALVISNGINTDIFKPDPESRAEIRRKLKIPENAILIGIIARYDPMKDHETFLKSAQSLVHEYKNMFFLIVGSGTIQGLRHRLSRQIICMDSCKNIHKLYNALDIITLPSAFGEGFPNVIGEAMACGIPAIVTDVGDSPFVAGETGIVIPPGNPEALSQAIKNMLKAPPSPQAVRSRITENFSVEQMVENTLQTLFPLKITP